MIEGAVTAYAPKLASLVEVDRAENVTLQNLTFVDADYFSIGTWTGPAGQPSDGAVRINFAQNVTIDQCDFRPSLSGYGIAVGNGTIGTKVLRSRFWGLGQGGVLFYGQDDATTTLNRSPSNGEVSDSVFDDLGKTLKHVAAVGLRAASQTIVARNRVTRVPRYAFQADTFYDLTVAGGKISRDNLFEYNVVDLAATETTDGGAFELLGSGDASLAKYALNNTIRYNKVSRVLGADSSDGAHVCQGEAYDPTDGCRGITWSIYLDGAYSGAEIYGNVLDGSVKGGLMINGGGNVSFRNNLVLAPRTESVLLNECWWPSNDEPPPFNVLKTNIFVLNHTGGTVIGLPGPPNSAECTYEPRLASDSNLFHSPNASDDLSSRALFPAAETLAAWQAGNGTGSTGPPFAWPAYDAASIVADPLFDDAPNGRVSSNSPAYALGWEDIPDIESVAARW